MKRTLVHMAAAAVVTNGKQRMVMQPCAVVMNTFQNGVPLSDRMGVPGMVREGRAQPAEVRHHRPQIRGAWSC